MAKEAKHVLLASGKAGLAGQAAWAGRARRVKASEGGGLAADDGGGGGGLEGGAPAWQAGQAGQVAWAGRERKAGRAWRAHGMQHGGDGLEGGGSVVEDIGKGNVLGAACIREGRASRTGSLARQGTQGEGKRRRRPR